MPWHVWTDDGWTQRAPISVQVRAQFQLYVPDDSGPVVHGRRLRAVDVLPTPMPADVYAEKKRSFNERLRTAALVPERQGTFLHVWVYCPKLTDLPDESPADRIRRFGAAVAAAERLRPDVFIGPEYFFTRKTPQIADRGVDHVYTAEEKALVEAAVRGAGSNSRGMLIVPGTVLWKDAHGAVRNTAIIHCRNEGTHLEHHKRNAHDDAAFATAAGGVWTQGTLATDFAFRTLGFRFQICADNGADDEQMKDFHLISAYDLGNVTSRAHQGGWLVLSDGVGRGRIEKTLDTSRAQTAPATTPSSGQFSLAVDVRKLA